MAKKDTFVVLSKEGEALLAPLMDTFLNTPVDKGEQNTGVALVCEDVEFTYPLSLLTVRAAQDRTKTAKLWVPPSAIAYAADISKPNAVGFRPE